MKKIEYKRTCNKCNNVWYVPKEYLDKLKSGKVDGALALVFFDVAQGSRNKQAMEIEIMKLNMCPKCNSSDYYEQIEELEPVFNPNAINKPTKTDNKTIYIALIIVAIIFLIMFIKIVMDTKH